MTSTTDAILALLERYRIARDRSGDPSLFPDGLTTQRIADEIGVSQATASRRARDLAERGLVEKVPPQGGWRIR